MSDNKSTWADWDKVFADSIAQNDAVIEALRPGPDDFIVMSDDKPPIVVRNSEVQIILTHLVERTKGLTTCCGRTWTELPLDDRCTLDASLANCQGPRT